MTYGDVIADMGMAIVPKLFLYFYRHLESGGERLADQEAMLLVHAIGKSPLAASTGPRQRRVVKLQRMGLLFIEAGQNQQTWDLSNLFHNLERVYYASDRSSPDFTLEVELAPTIARGILERRYVDVPEKWRDRAELLFVQLAGGGER